MFLVLFRCEVRLAHLSHVRFLCRHRRGGVVSLLVCSRSCRSLVVVLPCYSVRSVVD